MDRDRVPDLRDGLTRRERIVLQVLREVQKERGERNVPTALGGSASTSTSARTSCRPCWRGWALDSRRAAAHRNRISGA